MATILVAEDNEMNLEVLSRALIRAGHAVVSAGDGAEAVEKARSERPDLILMDLSLPEVDGWQATRDLKAASATEHIPIIALTAHALADDRARALEAGCDEYDTKPVDMPALLAKIRTLIEGPSA